MSDVLTACAAWRDAETTEPARDAVRERVRAALRAKHDTEDAGEDLAAFDAAIAAAGAENNENAALKHFEKLAKIPPASVRMLGSGAWRSQPPPPPILWRDTDVKPHAAPVVSMGEVAVLSGAGKGGKSHLCVTLAVAAAQAKRDKRAFGFACGLRVRSGHVVIVSYEDAPKRIDQRAEVLDAAPDDVLVMPDPQPLYAFDRDERRWNRSTSWEHIWNAIGAVRPVLVVLDTGPKAMGGETTDPGAVIGFLQALEAEARRAETGVLICAHDTKAARDAARSGAQIDAGAIAGSGQWHDSPRGVMHLVKTGPGDADRLLEAVKCAYGADGWGARLRPHYARDRYAGLTIDQRLDENGMLAARAELRAARREAQYKTPPGGAGAQSTRGIGRNRPPPGA